MKVLFATYPMAFHTPGGGEIQLLAYQKHLPSHGVEVTLFDPWNPHFLEHDIVHFFSCMGGSSHFCRFVKQLGLPLVVSSSLWITEETKNQYPIDEIRYQLSLADRVVANSNIECDTLARVLNLPREKFVTVYNGVDDIFFERVSPDLFRQQFNINQPFVLNVGNIEPRKNQLRLVQAMKEIPHLKLVLIGHARDEEYARQALKSGADQVLFVDALPHESELLRSAYAACEVFCLPSTLETPGLAALEAFACKRPVVITKEGSTREYFKSYAFFTGATSITDIANGVREALKNISQEAPVDQSPNIFSWNEVVCQLTTCYRSLQVHHDM
jgi:glycosyltransferase involved in cell wall biosynthesis